MGRIAKWKRKWPQQGKNRKGRECKSLQSRAKELGEYVLGRGMLGLSGREMGSGTQALLVAEEFVRVCEQAGRECVMRFR
jgi:hypothetical protein